MFPPSDADRVGPTTHAGRLRASPAGLGTFGVSLLLLLLLGAGACSDGGDGASPNDAVEDAAPDAEPGDLGPDVPDAGPEADGTDDAGLDGGDPDAADGEGPADADAGPGDAGPDAEVRDGGDGGSTSPDADTRAVDADGDASDAGGGCEQPDDCPDPGPCREAICTEGTCGVEPLADGTDCDDGNACSQGDHCEDGVCVGASSVSCDDDNPCTDDTCDPDQGCVHEANFASCDDGDPCTMNDSCSGGTCSGEPGVCDDDNPCTEDFCDPDTGECSHEPLADGADCDDGSACTTGDHCEDGACVPEATDGCDDGNPCTEDICSDGSCSHEPIDDAPCDDGDACTVDDECINGTCVSGDPADCDDGNPCTDNDCDPDQGCISEVTPDVPCDDGDACTLDETCTEGGACVPGDTLDCGNDNPCTESDCDPDEGCVTQPVEGDCDDGDACTTGDHCEDGACVGNELSCDDGNACTEDFCDPAQPGSPCEHAPLTCDDDNPCTEDHCDPDEGCVFEPVDTPCDDGNPCTTDDTCSDGTCSGESVDCDDGDPCTQDLCDPETGSCVNEPIEGPCDDGDPCTEGEVCEEDGLCDGGDPVDPDDGLACTIDGCTAEEGITHEPDDDACALGRVCDTEVGCRVADGVRIVVSRLAPLPGDEAPGPWLALRHVGDEPVDLVGLRLLHDGATAPLQPLDDAASLVLEPGERMAGFEPTAAEQTPEGFAFRIGSVDDDFTLAVQAESTLTLEDAAETPLDVLSLSELAEAGAAKPTSPTPVPEGAFPIAPEAPTQLGAGHLAEASDESINDDANRWCIWPQSDAAPGTSQLACSRVRLNEIRLGGGDGDRWIELHQPAGGLADGAVVRVVAPDGEVLASLDAPTDRAPFFARPLLRDGEEGIALPQLTDGSVQLVRDGTLLDVYGFGEVEAEEDAELGLPLFEAELGPPQSGAGAAVRLPDGVDTDSNVQDWQQQSGSPGEANGL